MVDPSFILKGAAARNLTELARELQALVDTRTAAMEHPLSVSDIELPQLPANSRAHGARH